jgi:hypothetical protein
MIRTARDHDFQRPANFRSSATQIITTTYNGTFQSPIAAIGHIENSSQTMPRAKGPTALAARLSSNCK